MAKPRVLTRCVANTYTRPTERIVEFYFPGCQLKDGHCAGGLIRFGENGPGGRPVVQLYRVDRIIRVTVQKERP